MTRGEHAVKGTGDRREIVAVGRRGPGLLRMPWREGEGTAPLSSVRWLHLCAEQRRASPASSLPPTVMRLPSLLCQLPHSPPLASQGIHGGCSLMSEGAVGSGRPWMLAGRSIAAQLHAQTMRCPWCGARRAASLACVPLHLAPTWCVRYTQYITDVPTTVRPESVHATPLLSASLGAAAVLLLVPCTGASRMEEGRQEGPPAASCRFLACPRLGRGRI